MHQQQARRYYYLARISLITMVITIRRLEGTKHEMKVKESSEDMKKRYYVKQK